MPTAPPPEQDPQQQPPAGGTPPPQDPPPQDPPPDPDGTDALGDAGKRALDRMKASLKAERDARLKAEAERDAARGISEQEKAQRAAEAAALAKANSRILRSEVRAAAKGVLADPTDAYRFLDLDAFDVDQDGSVDEQAITDALTELVRTKPYLAAAASPPGAQRPPTTNPAGFGGTADQGARAGAQRTEEQSLTAALGEAQKRRDFVAIVQIKNRLAALRAQPTA